MSIDEIAAFNGITLEEFLSIECTSGKLAALISIADKPPINFISKFKVPVHRKEFYQGSRYRNIYKMNDLIVMALKFEMVIGKPYDRIVQEQQLDKFEEEIQQSYVKLDELRNAISEKERILSKLEHSIQITGKQLQQALNDPLLDEDEILLLAGIRRLKCGVYFLIKDEQVVYVGQSINITQRIAEHTKTKDFDTFTYVQCKREDLNRIEALYITKLKPKYNYNSLGRLQLPMRFYKLTMPLKDMY
jgi:hypothetical protein